MTHPQKKERTNPVVGSLTVEGGVLVTLVCQVCGKQTEDRPTFRLTKLGGTRLHLCNPHWYVDGGTVSCPDCRTTEQSARMHRETWEDQTVREVCNELGITAELVARTSYEWVVS